MNNTDDYHELLNELGLLARRFVTAATNLPTIDSHERWDEESGDCPECGSDDFVIVQHGFAQRNNAVFYPDDGMPWNPAGWTVTFNGSEDFDDFSTFPEVLECSNCETAWQRPAEINYR